MVRFLSRELFSFLNSFTGSESHPQTARIVALPEYEECAPTGRQAEQVLGSEPEEMPSHPFREIFNLFNAKYLKTAVRVRVSSGSTWPLGRGLHGKC